MPKPLPRIQHQPMMTVCEVLRYGQWQTLTIEQALETGERYGHCPECKKRVRAHRKGRNGMGAHFEHLERNPDCSLSHKL